jgi:hypothetical protein
MYRKCGLPARVVIGLDKREEEKEDEGKSKLKSKPRAWVEFCLFDEAKNTVNWVPVDPVRLRKATPTPPKLETPWKYFGTHDELRGIMPFAFHFHPPTSVRSYGSPGFWGWLVTPGVPATASQGIVLDGFGSAVPQRPSKPYGP